MGVLQKGSLFRSFNSSPCFLAQRASIFLLTGPPADTVGVVGVVARSPGNHATLPGCDLVGLAL